MKLSSFGEKFAGESGIVSLMDDLGAALNENPEMIFMGGGNPAHLPALEAVFQQRLRTILDDPAESHSMLGIYQSPQGDAQFREQLAALLRREFAWPVSGANIAVANGSQSAFFILFNMLAGRAADGQRRSIHLPLAPEYIGYSDIGLEQDFFTATRPEIEMIDAHTFKYHVDFSRLHISEHTAALCVSRPTNPTGNVLTDQEVAQLDAIAREHAIPFIIDGAYGLPFPNIVFNQARPHWNDNTILVLSLSKLGLPGARTGIVVASETLIRAFTNANTIVSLACGNLGVALGKQLLRDGEILQLSRSQLMPFYRERAAQTVQWFHQALDGLPYAIHQPEGAIFLWLWFRDLPISSQQLYERLKARGVLIVPGHNFFPGIGDDWDHKQQCIRVSYAQDEQKVRAGIALIAEQLHLAYAQGA